MTIEDLDHDTPPPAWAFEQFSEAVADELCSELGITREEWEAGDEQ